MIEYGFGTGWRRFMELAKIRKVNRTRAAARKGNIITPKRAAALDRARENLMEGRVFRDSSADLINEAREERTTQL